MTSIKLCSLCICFAIFSIMRIEVHAQTKLWGLSETGGSTGGGFIYSTNNDGTGLTIQKEFIIDYPGATLAGQPTLAPNGKLYFTTTKGGINNTGVLAEFDPSTGVYTKKLDFTGPNGQSPTSGLLLASNGKMYGVTPYGGAFGQGLIYEFDPTTGTQTLKAHFIHDNNVNIGGLANPNGKLMEASDGYLYGMTAYGGTSNYGGIYRCHLNGSFQYTYYTNTVNLYTGTFGNTPGGLVQALNGKLYGILRAGGVSQNPVLFEFNPISAAYTVKYTFSAASQGQAAMATMMLGTDGKLYGTTQLGGANGNGVIFQYDPATSIYTKKADFNFGWSPSGDLVQASNGKVYGMCDRALFQFDLATSSLTQIADLSQFGYQARGGVVQASNGKLYGATTSGPGTFFEFDLSTSTTLKKFDFGASPMGSTPSGKLTRATNGKFYVTTTLGGLNNVGTLFEFDPSTVTLTKKIDFSSATSGATPIGSLSLGFNGKLYGTTLSGGANGGGTLFEFDPSTGTLITKVNLVCANGCAPLGGLVQTTNGKMYGTTNNGGANSAGVIFEFDPVAGTYNKKKDLGFYPSGFGGMPKGDLIVATNGLIYGTGGSGTTSSATGVIFEYNPSTAGLAVRYQFSSTVGYGMAGSVIQAANGKLYGLAISGGLGAGALFEFDPATSAFYSYPFPNTPVDGITPSGSLVQSDNGKFYGVTSKGGTGGVGVLFEFDRTTSTYTKKIDFNSAASSGYYDLQLLLDIPKLNQTISFGALPSKTYGDASFNPATASSSLPVTYNSSNPAVAVGGTSITVVGAGTTTITATQGGNAYYYPAPPIQQTLTVNKATLLATSNASKVYGSVNPALAISYNGFVGSDNASIIDTPPIATTSAGQYANAGSYAITVTGGADNNYLVTPVNGTLTISQAGIIVTANNQSKTYGAPIPSLTLTYSGFLGTDNSSVIDTPPSASCSVSTCSNVGTYAITLSGGIDNNYSMSYVNGNLSVTPAVLTATAGSLSRTFGSATLPTVTYTGFVCSDTPAVLDLPPVVSTSNCLDTGTYAVTPTGGNDNNYSFSYVGGTLTVTKATLTVAVNNSSRNYGSANPSFSFSYSGFQCSDNASVINTTLPASTVADSSSPPGDYPVSVSGWSDNNYNFSYVNGIMSILKLNQTISFTAPGNICNGSSFGLTGSSTSGLSISYASSNGNIISIFGGTASGTSAGSATITASQPGNTYYNSAPDVIQTINVLSNGGSITTDKGTNICKTGSTTLFAGAGSSYLWSPGGATSSYIIATDVGTYSVNYVNSNGCGASASITIIRSGTNCTNFRVASDDIDTTVVDPNPNALFGVSPNPASKEILVRLSAVATSDSPVSFTDMLGHQRKLVVVEKGQQEKKIPISDLEPGSYVVNIRDGKRYRQRILVITN